MIFVTVGTHEQPFNRLVEYMDKWAGKYREKVIIQTGFSNYVPQNCIWHSMIALSDMKKYISEARIVITHGGPSSFIMPLQIDKIPIVVPRKKELNEHINNHQIDFAIAVEKRWGNIIVVKDVEDLEEIIANYSNVISEMNDHLQSNNGKFCIELEKMINELVND